MKYLNFLEKHKETIGFTRGITMCEIQSIETLFNVKLPEAYKEYLLCFGKESGNLLSGYYTEYPILKENREDAIYALNFDDRIQLDKPIIENNYFFFAQWQGGVFFFFDCNENLDNPPVYIFEDTLKIYKYKDSFVDFIYEEGIKPLI